MKSCTGLCMSLGKATIYTTSINQKLNTTSSTEAELVGVSDGMPKITCTRYFMAAQGYNVDDVYVYQDNQSAILLEMNGMKSVGKNSRHMKIRYFFVTDRVQPKRWWWTSLLSHYKVFYSLCIEMLFLEYLKMTWL